MTPEDFYQQSVLDAVIADTPEAFWRRTGERTQFVYGDSSLAEILAAYTPVEKREDRAAPLRKTASKTGTE